MTKDEADKMIEQISDWLEAGAPGAVLDHTMYGSVAVDLARGYASDLLVSAGAKGFGGCRLCQG